MANEHIARRQLIGLGKEGTSGTATSVTDWIPRVDGLFTPKYEVKYDESGFGTIDEVREGQTTKEWTEVELQGHPRPQVVRAFPHGSIWVCISMCGVRNLGFHHGNLR